MSTCLTTKLDGVVNDSSFKTPNELRIQIHKIDNYQKARAYIIINSALTQKISIVNDEDGDNYFYDADNNNLGTSVQFNANVAQRVYCTNGNYEISVPNKYVILSIDTGRFSPCLKFIEIKTEDLRYLPLLTALNVSGSGITGNLKDIATCVNLTTLTIEHTNLIGDVEDLRPLTNLLYLRLARSNNIIGNFSALESMSKLRSFEVFQSTGLIGSLSSFAALSEIRWIDFPSINGLTSVEGNIASFANKPNLEFFSCTFQYNSVEGDISVFSAYANKLHTVYINTNNVSGDIGSLANNKKLRTFIAYQNKNLEGDLSEFVGTSTSNVLKPDLGSLDVGDTAVSGDITNIYAPMLTSFSVAGSGVTGDIDGFIPNMPNLLSFNASRSQLEGNIDSFVNCPKITSININSSRIAGDIASLATIGTLTALDIGYTNVSGNIVTGLANCTKLASISAFNCPNITGDLSQLNSNVNYFASSANGGVFTWSSSNARPSSAYIIALNNVYLGNDVDNMLINQANCKPNPNITGNININVRGTRSAGNTRASANEAIRTLMSKGYTVTINGALQTLAILDTDAIDTGEEVISDNNNG